MSNESNLDNLSQLQQEIFIRGIIANLHDICRDLTPNNSFLDNKIDQIEQAVTLYKTVKKSKVINVPF